MPIRKQGSAEPILEESNKKIAKKQWSEKDSQELAEEQEDSLDRD